MNDTDNFDPECPKCGAPLDIRRQMYLHSVNVHYFCRSCGKFEFPNDGVGYANEIRLLNEFTNQFIPEYLI